MRTTGRKILNLECVVGLRQHTAAGRRILEAVPGITELDPVRTKGLGGQFATTIGESTDKMPKKDFIWKADSTACNSGGVISDV